MIDYQKNTCYPACGGARRACGCKKRGARKALRACRFLLGATPLTSNFRKVFVTVIKFSRCEQTRRRLLDFFRDQSEGGVLFAPRVCKQWGAKWWREASYCGEKVEWWVEGFVNFCELKKWGDWYMSRSEDSWEFGGYLILMLVMWFLLCFNENFSITSAYMYLIINGQKTDRLFVTIYFFWSLLGIFFI